MQIFSSLHCISGIWYGSSWKHTLKNKDYYFPLLMHFYSIWDPFHLVVNFHFSLNIKRKYSEAHGLEHKMTTRRRRKTRLLKYDRTQRHVVTRAFITRYGIKNLSKISFKFLEQLARIEKQLKFFNVNC